MKASMIRISSACLACRDGSVLEVLYCQEWCSLHSSRYEVVA